MAFAHRLRRAATISASLVRNLNKPSLPSPFFTTRAAAAAATIRTRSLLFPRSFRSSATVFDRKSDFGSGGDDRKIGPDDILFEGCDYNHWLITMDFPKDPAPTPEEMVETYVQTAAKVVGSVEEAKKKIYACSTTTYQGFQLVCSEETSEKFRGLPGVVFILPDSYIDPVNKEYGGDKYDNGVITPRPPPIQYGRQGRYGDRNRNYDRPRYDRQRDSMPVQQGNRPYDRQPPMQGDGRNFAQQQNFGPPGQDGRGYPPPPPPGNRNYAPQQNFGPPGQDGRGYPPPPAPGNRSYAPQQNFGPPGQDGTYPPPPMGGNRNYAPQQNYGPPGGYQNQGGQGNFAPQGPPQGQGGYYGNAGPAGRGDFRQGYGTGNSGENRQGQGSGYAGENREGTGSGHGQN